METPFLFIIYDGILMGYAAIYFYNKGKYIEISGGEKRKNIKERNKY
jgi:hypothetical protein